MSRRTAMVKREGWTRVSPPGRKLNAEWRHDATGCEVRMTDPTLKELCQAVVDAWAEWDGARGELTERLARNALDRAVVAAGFTVDECRAILAVLDDASEEGRREGLREAAQYAENRRILRTGHAAEIGPPSKRMWLAFALEACVIRDHLRRLATHPRSLVSGTEAAPSATTQAIDKTETP